jgi:peptide/nickel transport system substrate-binding protein/oligopeptide transport system substrate-binding protein
VRVRDAFDLAIDKTVLANNQILQGSVIATNHIVPLGMPGYNANLNRALESSGLLTADLSKAKQLMDQFVNSRCPNDPIGTERCYLCPITPNLCCPKVQALCMACSYAIPCPTPCELAVTTCPPITLVDSNDPVAEQVDNAIVQMWKGAFPGYPITTEFIDFNTELSMIYSSKPPQIFGIGWTADYPDPQDWLSLQFGTGAINNLGHVQLPEANTLMAQADVNLNPTSRFSEYNQAEQLLVNAGAWIPLNQQKTFYNVPSYVHNFTFNALGMVPLTGSASWQTIYLTTR